MKTALNRNIEISVKPRFEETKSSWINSSFIHSYEIGIKNLNHFPVKLLERCWYIFDSTEGNYTVFGEGVIGKKPVIEHSETYTYSSYCELTHTIGRMHGFFNLRNEITGEILKVSIPSFNLEVPLCLN